MALLELWEGKENKEVVVYFGVWGKRVPREFVKEGNRGMILKAKRVKAIFF